jgi:hypothetical protein
MMFDEDDQQPVAEPQAEEAPEGEKAQAVEAQAAE